MNNHTKGEKENVSLNIIIILPILNSEADAG